MQQQQPRYHQDSEYLHQGVAYAGTPYSNSSAYYTPTAAGYSQAMAASFLYPHLYPNSLQHLADHNNSSTDEYAAAASAAAAAASAANADPSHLRGGAENEYSLEPTDESQTGPIRGNAAYTRGAAAGDHVWRPY